MNNNNQTWEQLLTEEEQKPYFISLFDFLKQQNQKNIYPSQANIFNAIKFTPFSKVNVVILGQDPYHGSGQAHGLCFSVDNNVPLPPSLKNIYKELQNDLGTKLKTQGNLSGWAKQGVLLLNSVLTVEQGKPASHARKGWETFTNRIIEVLSLQKKGVIFLLWGSYAQNKGEIIDSSKHHILKTSHPSPFSAHKGFLGCKHFSKTNQLLISQQKTPVNWAL